MSAAGRGRLRDAALICDAVLPVPGEPIRCELDAGHVGRKHQRGCTHWGTAAWAEDSSDGAWEVSR